jgi:hypothetical protein
MPKPHTFVLSKIYRQSNPIEGAVLSRIREGTQTDIDLRILNSRIGNAPWDATTLSPYNRIVDSINQARYDSLTTDAYEFHSKKTGTYKTASGPLNDILRLKEGCRVLIKSNMKYPIKGIDQVVVNGDSGAFLGVDKHDRLVILRDSDGEEVYVKPKKFEKPRVKAVENEDGEVELVESIAGKFTQYPVVLGYAMTIHKSQGSTMNRVHLELPSGKPFAPGLLYVALSRVRSFKDLTLSREIRHSDIVPPVGLKTARTQQYEL